MNKDQHGELRRRRVRKRKSSREGEKIVREDGSVVIRKRSKKRRSHQAHKMAQQKKRKRNLIVLLTIFVFSFISILALSFSIAYHNSAKFEEELLSAIHSETGSKVDLKGFNADYTQASASSLKLEWPKESRLLRSLHLNELKTKYLLGGLLSSNWHVDRINAARGLLVLDAVGECAPSMIRVASERFQLASIRCQLLDIEVGGEKSKWAEGVGVTMRKRSSSLDLLLDSGVVHLPLIEHFEINQGLVRILDDRYKCAVRFEDKTSHAAISLKAEIAYDPPPLIPMNLQLESLRSDMIFGESVAEILRGEGSCEDAKFVYNKSNSSIDSIEADLSFEEVQFYGFPFLAELSKILRKQWYRRPHFLDEASLSFEKAPKGLSLQRITLIQGDRLILLGEFHVDGDEVVSGELEVGVPIEHKKIIEENVREGVFGEVRDGYLWQKVVLTGKLGELSDDFGTKVLSRGELIKREKSDPIELLSEEKKSADKAFNDLLSD